MFALAMSLLPLVVLAQSQPFTVIISTARSYQLGDEVTCKVTIFNSQNTDYYLLKRGTPLDTINANIFSVSRESTILQYDGLLYQRVLPTPDEYILLRAKTTTISIVDLSQSYPLNTNENHEVQLDSTFFYYQQTLSNTSRQHVLSNRVTFSLIGNKTKYRPTEADALRQNSTQIQTLDLDFSAFEKAAGYIAPKMAGTYYNDDVQVTYNVYGAVFNTLGTSYNAVSSNTKNLYTTWFGTRYTGYMDTVKGAYQNIYSAMMTYQYTIYFDGPHCKEIQNVIAYTYKGSQVIYLCQLYRSEPDTRGVNTKLGTILHEFTHAVAYTDDIIYGQSNCAALAQSAPQDAIKNADNYRCFTESLYL